MIIFRSLQSGIPHQVEKDVNDGELVLDTTVAYDPVSKSDVVEAISSTVAKDSSTDLIR